MLAFFKRENKTVSIYIILGSSEIFALRVTHLLFYEHNRSVENHSIFI